MNIGKFIIVILKRAHLILLCVFVAMLFEAVWNYIILQPRFRATAKLMVYENPSSRIQIPMKDQKRLDAMMRNEKVSRIAMKKLGVKNITTKSAFQFLKKIEVHVDDIGVISISFPGNNPKECAKVVNAFAGAFISNFVNESKKNEKMLVEINKQTEQIDRLNSEIAEQLKNEAADTQSYNNVFKAKELAEKLKEQHDSLHLAAVKDNKKQKILILEKAKPPEIPFWPDRRRNINRGLIASLLFGIYLAFVLENRKIRSSLNLHHIHH